MPEDVYEFFELQVQYPTPEEVQSFLGGPCMVLGLEAPKAPIILELLKLDRQFPVKSVTYDPEPVFRFWFGGQ